MTEQITTPAPPGTAQNFQCKLSAEVLVDIIVSAQYANPCMRILELLKLLAKKGAIKHFIFYNAKDTPLDMEEVEEYAEFPEAFMTLSVKIEGVSLR